MKKQIPQQKNNSTRPGATPLIEINGLAQELGIHSAYIKDESKNPFGTIKDRRNYYIFQEATRLKVDKLVLITSGNNGYSLAQFAKDSPLKIVCIISRDLPQETKNILREHAYQVIELNLEHKILRPEELIAFAREKEDEVIWEVTNGYEECYASIVDEIFQHVTPNYIIVPVGSGGIFLGIMQGLELQKAHTKVIGIGTQNTIYSFADKLSTPWTPYLKALEHYEQLGHKIYRLNEPEIKASFNKYKNLVNCEPSSSIVFTAPTKYSFKESDVVVFLNSGKTAI